MEHLLSRLNRKSSDPKPAPRRAGLFPAAVMIMGAVFLFLAIRLFLTSPPGFFQSEDKKFERFTEEVFRSEMSGNTLNLHYTVANPADYGIDTSSVSLGDASPKARQNAIAALENYRNVLNQFDYKKLSEKHQLTYDIFSDYLDTELSASAYLLYDEPLSPTLGIQAQLPILLAEYTFRTKGDIEDYLTLLTQIPDYFSGILAFEREKAEAGLFMSRDCAAMVVSQCEDFINDPADNYLIGIFNEKIDEVTNLTADEKIAYKNRNSAILQGYVIPAYRELGTKIASYAGSSKNQQGLYYFPEGREYYQYLVRSGVGDDRSIEEIEEAVKVRMVEDYSAICDLVQQGAQKSSSSVTAASDGSSSSVPAAMLSELREKITDDFPLLPSVSCNIKSVHKSLQDYLSPAFYLTPAIDDYENNVIYINPGSNYSGIDLFTTLAHEGYPGHLYQSVYFNSTKPDLLRTLLDVGGYTEGWATYVEMYSFGLWEEDPQLAALYQKNRSFTLGLASLLDIGIHYRGYSLSDVTSFLEKLGFESGTAQSLYQTVLQSPSNYLNYYVGYLNFSDLRDDVKAVQSEQFSLREFHRMVLEAGPCPFYILRRELSRELAN